MDTITLGGGCFWCIEAQLKTLNGVISVESGYAGGSTENPTYEEVCLGLTNHAEVVQVVYDSSIISTQNILEAYWLSHNPTQLNQQGNDIGTQYRSVIFYHTEEQKNLAEEMKKNLNRELVFGKQVVTEIMPIHHYYPAEKYHQDYYQMNPTQGYCQFVIAPKVKKFKKLFMDKIK